MSYIKINGDDTHYIVSIMPFTTQHGYNAIRFIGETIPETDKGFKLYDDNDEEISDFSDYTYIYRQNEYSVEHDEIVYPKGSDQPLNPSPYDNLSRRINQVSSQINNITPYVESRIVGYQDTECVFTDIYKDGVLTATVLTEDGEFISNTVEKIDNFVRVNFEQLNTVATVTIQIQ